jgi:hypothetical protein
MSNQKTIKEITDNLVRDLCSVEFRSKSKTRELIEEYRIALAENKYMKFDTEFWFMTILTKTAFILGFIGRDYVLIIWIASSYIWFLNYKRLKSKLLT